MIRLSCLLLQFSVIKVKRPKQHVFHLWHHLPAPVCCPTSPWNNEKTQEAMDSQVFTLFKAITPLSQGPHGSKHKKHKASCLPSTSQFAKPLQVPSVLGNPRVWVHTEIELTEGSPGMPIPSSVSVHYPRNELELEQTSLPTSSSMKHPG